MSECPLVPPVVPRALSAAPRLDTAAHSVGEVGMEGKGGGRKREVRKGGRREVHVRKGRGRERGKSCIYDHACGTMCKECATTNSTVLA